MRDVQEVDTQKLPKYSGESRNRERSLAHRGREEFVRGRHVRRRHSPVAARHTGRGRLVANRRQLWFNRRG